MPCLQSPDMLTLLKLNNQYTQHMLKKIALTAAIVACVTAIATAQDEPAAPKQKIFEHQVGVQANELIRQVFNFNNNNNTLNNPYLLTYSLNWKKPGIGIRLGIGPDFRSFKEDDGIVQQENNINVMNLRFGLEKTFVLSSRWSAGAGVDYVFSNDVSYTKTFTRSFDSTSTDIASATTTKGYGAMAWLRYHITPHILVGTETSFYYRTGDFKQDISITTRTSGGPIGQPAVFETKITKIDNEVEFGTFNLPMVLYLIVRF